MKMKKIISFLLAMVMVLGIVPGVQAADVDVTTGLILHYSFDENLADYGIIMDMAGSNSPTIINNEEAGSYLQTVDGVAYFPGYSIKDGRTQLGAALKLPNDFNQGITDFTYSAWLMYDHYSDPYYNVGYTRFFDFGNIGSGSNNPRNSIFARFETEENVIRIQDRGIAGGSDDSASYVEYSFNKDVMTDWMLFTFTMEKNEATGYYESKVYIDGEEIPELASTDKFTRSLDDLGEMNNRSNGMYIGRTVWAATNQYIEENPDFCGQMDDVRIYDRAITEEQIAYLYENTKPETGRLNLVKGYNVDSVTTVEGEAPALPQYADYTISFQADEQREEITWDTVDESLYSTAGSFTVKGTTALGDVMTTVDVIKKNDAAEDGLLLYYNFDTDPANPTTITDVSGNGNDATVLNTVEEGNEVNNVLTVAGGVAVFPGMTSVSNGWWSRNYLGAALRLPSTINNGVSSFTYSAWINTDSNYEYNSGMTRFFDFGNIADGSYNSIFARYTPSSGQMRIQDRQINLYRDETLSEKPFTDSWGFFTFVYDYNEETEFYETKVYVNGKEVTNLSTTTMFTRALSDLGTLDDSSNGMFIGRTVWAANNSNVTDNPDFKGMMDEIRLYNRALTEAEITELYNTTSPVGKITMDSFTVEDVTTLAGDYPLLPETVEVIYTTGTVKTEKVEWDIVTSDKYSQEGTFTVAGVTEAGNAVEVKVLVIKKETSTLAQGLVLYYNFDNDAAEPSEIIDVSGNSNNATVINNVQTVTSDGGNRPGQGSSTTTQINNIITVTDGVANFPGYSQVTVNNGWWGSTTNTYLGAALKLPNDANENIEDFTYSAWIYADTDYTFASGLQRFFDFGTDVRDSIFYRYVPATGESRFQDRGVGNSADDQMSFVSATLEDNPFADNWAHLVVTYKKSDAGEYYTPTIYINGVERYEYDNSITTLTRSLGDLGTLTDSTNGLFIGRTVWAANNSNVNTNPDFKGKMDEIRLYNRALSASEVSELYNSKKPSDMPIDYDSMPKMQIAVTEDVEVSTAYPDTNREGQPQMLISSNNGAANTRYGFMRTGDLTTGQIASMANCEKAVLSVYVTLVDNWGSADEFYCYGLTGDATAWDVNTITMNNYAEQIGGSISNIGVSEVGELLDTQIATGQSKDFYMQWDVTDFVKEHAAEDFSFLLTCGSNVAYIHTSESGIEGQMPELIIYQQGTPITVNRVDKSGNHISDSIVYGVMGQSYTYTVADALISHNNFIYVADEAASTLTVEEVTGEDVITIVYDIATDLSAEDVNVRTYVGRAPALPRVLTITNGEYSALFAVQWDAIDSSEYAQIGEFKVNGTILGTGVGVQGNVTVFPEYNGGVGTDLTITIYADGKFEDEILINRSYGSTFTLGESYAEYLGYLYDLDRIEGDVTEIGGRLVMDKLNQHIELYFTMNEMLEATLAVKIKADDFEETTHTLTATATVLNTEKTDETVTIAIADYNDNGEMTNVVRESAVVESRTGETVTFTKSLVYDAAKHKNSKVFLWTDDMQPVAEVVNIADVPVSGYIAEEVVAMMPTYEGAVDAITSANTYWQTHTAYNAWAGGHAAFWDTAAYHTGNMEYYKLLGDEDMLQYSINWANYNDWMGNTSTIDPSQWTWGYTGDRNSSGVLFGDWQICFQSYIDMYNFGVVDADLSRVREVMDYQISKDEDGFWWWADALYMVMPVMTKLYKLTGDEAYLDALYKYFRYAKELMYDGPGGIPTSADGYTTSASLRGGASYSDPDDYKYLFFRDAGYVYPLNPNPGHADEKNFWARGNGWVFAGLSKVLSDMPESYAHYDEFYNTYMEMAQAIIACQETDDDGYGFWTQSMLQNYPIGNNGNDEGYETSGTAFFTYGLFWGINNGLLDEETYLEPTIRAWGYLENVAMHDSGKIGYVQPIGSNATSATSYDTTQNFGVGAFLLAGCEAARWAQAEEDTTVDVPTEEVPSVKPGIIK